MAHEIVSATYIDFLQFYTSKIPRTYVLRSGGVPVAFSGTYDVNGETWAFLDVKGRLKPKEGIAVIRKMLSELKKFPAGRTILVTCHKDVHEGAERLLARVGFTKTDRIEKGLEVWQWQS